VRICPCEGDVVHCTAQISRARRRPPFRGSRTFAPESGRAAGGASAFRSFRVSCSPRRRSNSAARDLASAAPLPQARTTARRIRGRPDARRPRERVWNQTWMMCSPLFAGGADPGSTAGCMRDRLAISSRAMNWTPGRVRRVQILISLSRRLNACSRDQICIPAQTRVTRRTESG